MAADATVAASTGVVGSRFGTAGAEVAFKGGSTLMISRSGSESSADPWTSETWALRRSSSVTVRGSASFRHDLSRFPRERAPWMLLSRHTGAMRLQIASPSDHPQIAGLPFSERLDDWTLPDMHGVLGLHRHVVRLIEHDGTCYVVKELPDELALREYRLLRELDDDGLPTVEVVAAVTDKAVAARA